MISAVRHNFQNEYAETLETDKRVMYINVMRFFAALGRVSMKIPRRVAMDEEETHRYFDQYARALGLPDDHMIKPGENKSPAVLVFFRKTEEEGKSWPPLYVVDQYHKYGDLVDTDPEVDKVLMAAREVCRKWLPLWNI